MNAGQQEHRYEQDCRCRHGNVGCFGCKIGENDVFDHDFFLLHRTPSVDLGHKTVKRSSQKQATSPIILIASTKKYASRNSMLSVQNCSLPFGEGDLASQEFRDIAGDLANLTAFVTVADQFKAFEPACIDGGMGLFCR
jgi:hypothetical protein